MAIKMHLRSPQRLRSFGHMIRDNMAALFGVAERLGADPLAYRWLLWPTGEIGNVKDDLFKHYRSWSGGIETQAWEELLQECDAGAQRSPWLVARRLLPLRRLSLMITPASLRCSM